MCFGLKNAAQALHRLMGGILRGIPSVFVYLDDIVLASTNPTEHTTTCTKSSNSSPPVGW